MKSPTSVITFFFIAILLNGCDYYTEQKVLVLDRSNQKPIPSAHVSIGPYHYLTDSVGYYHMQAVTGDMTNRIIRVEKSGYQIFQIELELDDGYITYKQKADSIYTLGNHAFSVLNDTLVIQLEKIE